LSRIPLSGKPSLTTSGKSLAVIQNGHIIKLSDNPEKRTGFDQNFEIFFDKASNNLNATITSLSEIRVEHFQREKKKLYQI